jgi:hypothetical protein
MKHQNVIQAPGNGSQHLWLLQLKPMLRITSRTPTMGLSKKGKPCIVLNALVAAAVSVKTTQACPRSLKVLSATTSMILPNWPNNAYIHFLSSAESQEQRAYVVSEARCPCQCVSASTLKLAFLGQLLIEVVDVDAGPWGDIHCALGC